MSGRFIEVFIWNFVDAQMAIIETIIEFKIMIHK